MLVGTPAGCSPRPAPPTCPESRRRPPTSGSRLTSRSTLSKWLYRPAAEEWRPHSSAERRGTRPVRRGRRTGPRSPWYTHPATGGPPRTGAGDRDRRRGDSEPSPAVSRSGDLGQVTAAGGRTRSPGRNGGGSPPRRQGCDDEPADELTRPGPRAGQGRAVPAWISASITVPGPVRSSASIRHWAGARRTPRRQSQARRRASRGGR